MPKDVLEDFEGHRLDGPQTVVVATEQAIQDEMGKALGYPYWKGDLPNGKAIEPVLETTNIEGYIYRFKASLVVPLPEGKVKVFAFDKGIRDIRTVLAWMKDTKARKAREVYGNMRDEQFVKAIEASLGKAL